MAARRLAASTVDWAEFAKKIPDVQRASFLALKGKQDGYVKTINALPANLPKIDWAHYKAKIPVAGMVDDFQKKYEGLQIPYPKDSLTSNIDAQAVQQKAAFETFVTESKARIASLNTELAKWEELMPIEEMNLEEALEVVPHLVVDPNKPSIWPHNYDMDKWDEYIAALKEYEKAHPDGDH